MNKFILITISLILMGCMKKNIVYDPKDFKMEMKYCINQCLHSSFGMFHNQGQSWGTGSSSMNGLTQTQIFDRMVLYCEEYYKNESCCKRPFDDYRNQVVKSHQHGHDYGACVK